MSHTLESAEKHSPVPERRRHRRQQIRSLAYAEISKENGGVVLNISEGGFAIQAAKPLVGDGPVPVRLELPECDNWVEAGGKIVWASESKKRGAVQFVDLPEEARKQIQDWISLEALPDEEFEEENTPLVERPETEELESQLAIPEVATPAPVAPDLVVQEQAQGLIPPAEAPAVPHPTEVADVISVSTGRAPEPAGDVEFTPTAHAAPPPADLPVQHGRRWGFAAVAAVLAVVSWIAGMAVARTRLGAVAGALGLKKAGPGESVPAQAGGAVSAPATMSTFQIEVVDANNRHWLLTSASAASVPVQTPRPQAPASVAARAPKTKIMAEPWAFGRPGLPPGKAIASGSEENAPPLPLLQPSDNAESAVRAVAPADSHGLIPEPPASPKASGQSSRVQMAKLLYRVEPVYPWAAKNLHLEGAVKLRATIGRDGTVRKLEPVEGLPMFTQAAMAAVRQWRYEPAILDGQPIEAEANIIVGFRLPH